MPSLNPSLLFATAALAFAGLAAVPALADTATAPMNLGTLGGASSVAWSVSADGSVIAGIAKNASGYDRAFRWTATGGMQDLGTFGGTVSQAREISDSGTTIVGYANTATKRHAFRWTQETGMVDLGTLGLGGLESWANSVNSNGSVVVGESAITGNAAAHAFRWTQETGMVDLGTLGGIYIFSEAMKVSDDGSVVAGQSFNSSRTYNHAFRWTQETGMVDLGTLGGTYSFAADTSADGSVVVGWSSPTGDVSTPYHAFRWTQSGGMVDLGTLGGTQAVAREVSADGSIVVGESRITASAVYHAFRWTQETGMKDLNALLAEADVNMSGITLTSAVGLSANGQFIVGQGDFPGATARAFLVCYDPESGCVGLTTGEAQAASADKLAEDRRAAMIESRAAANELLGMTQPMERRSFVRAGAMFGSAMGYIAGQASTGGLTALGGLGYGRQDYDNVAPSDALTLAAALRYTFPDPFGDRRQALRPFAELGGWATPEETLTFTRDYANGSGSNSGSGSADASAFAGYARAGLIWDATSADRLAGYGEFGRQYLSVSSYVEASGAGRGNPFPAAVDGGLFWMNIARAGVSWTHDLGASFAPNGQPVPLSFTLAGAAARSFDPHNGLNAALTAAGAVATPSQADTWGEFGGRLSAQFAKHLSLGLNVSGIVGPAPVGASVHGGVSLTFAF